MWYNEAMKGITTDLSQFERFIELDALYVDKTRHIHRLVSDPRHSFFFIARPRRYGKSLFCSTLHALFDGRRDLFSGLYIAEKTDYAFERFPVIHLNFAVLAVSRYDWFIENLVYSLQKAGRDLGIDAGDGNPSLMLRRLLEQIDGRAAIIIDEFDAPITSALSVGAEHAGMISAVLSDLFSVIKNCSEHIRFFFITGVTKLANISIFSSLNNLTDLSMDPHFADAFGYTEAELLEYFGEAIDEHFSEHCDEYGTKEHFIDLIREHYDGYRFSADSEATVYNPVSIGSFFTSGCRFQSYWNLTGQSTMAVDMAAAFPLSEIMDGADVPLSAFADFDIARIYSGKLTKENAFVLLYYAGYMTIKDGNGLGITLGFPNREVASSFTSSLVSRYAAADVGSFVYEGSRAAADGDVAGLLKAVDDYLALFSYQLVDKEKERTFHMLFHAFMVCLGSRAYAEEAGYRGRADEVVRIGRWIYVFELKIGSGAEAALRQIKTKGYADRHAVEARRTDRRVIICGIDISMEEGRIAEWKAEEIE